MRQRFLPVTGRTAWALGALFAVYGAAVAWSSRENSVTYDEGGHVTAGIVYLQTGDLSYYHHNPPLVKVLNGLMALPFEPRVLPPADRGDANNWISFFLPFVRDNADRFVAMVDRARLISLGFAALLALVAYHWARELFGAAAGVLALLLVLLDPSLTAMAGLATQDSASVFFFMSLFVAVHRWVKTGSWASVLVAGAAAGLGVASKFSNVLAVAIAALLVVVTMGRRLSRRHLGQWAAAMVLAILLVDAAYAFSGVPTRLGELSFRSELFTGQPLRFHSEEWYAERQGSRFAGTLLGSIPLPLPAELFLGFDDQRTHFERGLETYLLGSWRGTGSYAYYLIAWLTKSPTVWLLMLLAVVALMIAGRLPRLGWRDELFIWAPAIVFFVLVSNQRGINHHYRYVLPALPALYVGMARLACLLEAQPPRARRWLTAVGIAALVWPLASVFPHQLSFFNRWVGGPEGGHRILADSNIDWGQDLVALRRWLAAERQGAPLYLYYFGTIAPSLYGIRDFGSADFREPEQLPPGSIVAMSVNLVLGMPAAILDDNGQQRPAPRLLPTWLRERTPVAKAGHSIWIYRL